MKRRIFFPSQFRVVFTRVWVNIVPSAGDISNCRLDLSVGPIYRRQSRLRSHAIIDIHRVSIPGQAHSGVTETEITTGENCDYDSNIRVGRFSIHCSLAFFTLRGWAHGPCIACLYPDILSRCFIARPVLEQRKDLLGYILG